MDTSDAVDGEEIDRKLEAIFGPPPRPPEVTAGALDRILASRTHVKVLRVLVALDRHINLTGADVARRAEASAARVLEVLRALTSTGMVTAYRAPGFAIYSLSEDHPLREEVRALFQREASLVSLKARGADGTVATSVRPDQ